MDLCGSIYRTSQMHSLVSAAMRAASPPVTNPNTLEVALNNTLHSSVMCCLDVAFAVSSPCVSVITVNRVQSTYDVPVYESDIPLESINDMIYENNANCIDLQRCLPDYTAYKSCIYTSVHIPDFYVTSAPSPVSCLPFISVLLPIHNGAAYMQACLESILSQEGVLVEIVIVLNGCTDNSRTIAAEYKQRNDRIIVVELPHADLIEALDIGLQRCSSDFVARMDVDDIMLPNRCYIQTLTLQRQSHLHVVGGQAIVFSERGEEVAAGIPCDVTAVQWETLFRCCVLHPTVMFRKHIIMECGGYSNNDSMTSASCVIEDYCLWTRVLDRLYSLIKQDSFLRVIGIRVLLLTLEWSCCVFAGIRLRNLLVKLALQLSND